jgi:hypothetical protein
MKTQIRILILLAFSFFYLTTTLYAQEKFDLRESTKKHEISIGVADLFSKPDPVYYSPIYTYDMVLPYYYPNYYEPETVPKLALRYKYNFGKVALRAGFDFTYWDRENHSKGNDLENKYTQLYGNYKIGAELHTNFRKVQLVYGIDFFFIQSVMKNEYESENIIWVGEEYLTEIIENKSTNTYIEFGVSPLIGIKYYLLENLSIGVETSYSIGYYKDESKSTYNEETSKNWTEGIHSRFGPIGILSLNVHF